MCSRSKANIDREIGALLRYVNYACTYDDCAELICTADDKALMNSSARSSFDQDVFATAMGGVDYFLITYFVHIPKDNMPFAFNIPELIHVINVLV